jgi:hypothetical protein
MLEHWKSLDMNDFLHDFCPYVANRPCIEKRLVQPSKQGDLSSDALPARTFIDFNIFGDDQENAGLRPRAAIANPPNWGTSFLSGGVRINEFGTNDGGDFIKDATLSGADPGSLSRGYRVRGQMEPPASSLDASQGCRPTRLRNMVRASEDGP